MGAHHPERRLREGSDSRGEQEGYHEAARRIGQISCDPSRIFNEGPALVYTRARSRPQTLAFAKSASIAQRRPLADGISLLTRLQ